MQYSYIHTATNFKLDPTSIAIINIVFHSSAVLQFLIGVDFPGSSLDHGTLSMDLVWTRGDRVEDWRDQVMAAWEDV